MRAKPVDAAMRQQQAMLKRTYDEAGILPLEGTPQVNVVCRNVMLQAKTNHTFSLDAVRAL
eukprot:3783684-Rhodomonas_salina.1